MAQAAVARVYSPYENFVNPQWVRLLELLQMNVRYSRCAGAELFAEDGRRYLDFLAGYCVHNTGHNHPKIVAALHDELSRSGPAMLQSHVPELAGELAANLCARARACLSKVYFCSSGSEGVEAAIKFARAQTQRDGLVYAKGAFHGLTCGALSLMDDPFWTKGFGPLLRDTRGVPFGDLEALRTALADKSVAAFVVEPIQGEAGIRVSTGEYLREAQALCRRFGTLFVLDEVQTGMYRTGGFLAAHHYDVDPDMVVLAKALSGGLIPVGAVLMTDAIYKSVYSSLRRSIVHTSTYSENALAMRAGLATLDVIDEERLGARATELGEYLRNSLRSALEGYEMVAEVRGIGLLNGIEFKAPRRLRLRLLYEAFMKIHPGMFGQVAVMRLFRDGGILTQMCGNNFLVLKAAPPLVVTKPQIDTYVSGVRDMVDLMHHSASYWTEALRLARRAINI